MLYPQHSIGNFSTAIWAPVSQICRLHINEGNLHMDMKRKKILVVSDELDMRIFLSNLLDAGGFKPTEAENGAEGLKMATAMKPALIILDVMMSNKEGIQIYRNLKNDKTLKKIPVIMLSAIDRKTFFFYEKFKSIPSVAGVPEPEAYLEKPPEAEELMGIVQMLTKTVAEKNQENIKEESTKKEN